MLLWPGECSFVTITHFWSGKSIAYCFLCVLFGSRLIIVDGTLMSPTPVNLHWTEKVFRFDCCCYIAKNTTNCVQGGRRHFLNLDNKILIQLTADDLKHKSTETKKLDAGKTLFPCGEYKILTNDISKELLKRIRSYLVNKTTKKEFADTLNSLKGI